MKIISIIVPVYNEEDNIGEFYKRLKEVAVLLEEEIELIFINDGSIDNTSEELIKTRNRDNRVKIVEFSKNFGHQIALTAGIDLAVGDAVIMIDADLQHPPELIPEMVEAWREGSDIVYTVRDDNRDAGWFKKITSNMFYVLINRFSKVDIPKGTADFRLLDRKVVDSLKSFRERTRFIRGLISWVGYESKAINYVAEKRFKGSSKYSFTKMLKFAISGITSFSTVALYISTVLGFIIAGISFIYALYAIYTKFFTDKVLPGWTSILVSILFLGGIQLIAIGILGEYLAKVYEEVKRRPLYIIKNRLGFDE